MQGMEHEHEDVFGKSFSLYNRVDIDEFIEPFEVRFRENGIDPDRLFAGKRCLDAGCGGRGSIFMLQHGAKSVNCVDISETNIQSTTRNLEMYGFAGKFETALSTLEKIPYADNEFDFVWCNGVVMHAANPDACLSELVRVLKVGGKSWIYIYGSGGIYWYIVSRIREILRAVTASQCLAALQLIKYPVRFIAEYMDDWKVPYLRTYVHADLGRRMTELGLSESAPLQFGMSYDTSHRRAKFANEADLFGEGDLRYLVEKIGGLSKAQNKLSDSEYGSDYTYPLQAFGSVPSLMDQIAKMVSGQSLRAISACAQIQYVLREFMSETTTFDLPKFERHLESVISLLKAAA